MNRQNAPTPRGSGGDSASTRWLTEPPRTRTTLEILEEGDIKAVQVTGTLDGYPDVRVATRYEVRPCEPGVRIRSELANGSPDSLSVFLTDAFYWGGRQNLAFTPGLGSGFSHPSFGLTDIATAFRDIPFMVAGLHTEPAATYGVLSCTDETLSGFQSEEISALGPEPRILPPRDWEASERFVFAAAGASVSAGVDLALELRDMLWDEPYITLSGVVTAPGGHLGDTLRASVEVREGTPGSAFTAMTPWTHILPGADGRFSARVPTNRDYVLVTQAFGADEAEVAVAVGDEDVDVGTLTLEAVGEVTIDVTVDGIADHALVFVVPTDDATEEATLGTTFGHFEECAPLLGFQHQASPACNRVLVNGPTTIALRPGAYSFFTVVGPFSSLGAAEGVTVTATTGQSVLLEVRSLPVQPAGTLSGDFHVHGGASFDAQIPDADRVKAFLAARIEVVASTEHDTVADYAEAMAALGASARMQLITGTESTGHILFPYRTDSSFPRVVGHWNFWPVPYDPAGPYRGAAWDELAEPGLLMTRQEDAGWDAEEGVVQLNHPLGGVQFGRDYSWGSAAGFDGTEDLLAEYDGTGQSLYFHKPEGARYSNDEYDVQEVMNGTRNEAFLQYRAFWFWLLNQGIVRGGTANSDSHTLTENVIGTPRNLVFTETTLGDFDLATFDADVRAGHVLGTNGPVILAWTVDATGATREPGLDAFVPDERGTLHVEIVAAPWVPVTEVRFVANGELRGRIELETQPADPWDETLLQRYAGDVPLTSLLPQEGDAWIVVEAGAPLTENADLDCNGFPDTGDNDGNGEIDWRDVEGLEEDPEVSCLETVGPLAEPPEPDRGSAEWYFRTVTPHGYPLAFTNPFLLDRDGGGFTGAP